MDRDPPVAQLRGSARIAYEPEAQNGVRSSKPKWVASSDAKNSKLHTRESPRIAYDPEAQNGVRSSKPKWGASIDAKKLKLHTMKERVVQLVCMTAGGVPISQLAALYNRMYGARLEPETCGAGALGTVIGIPELVEQLLDFLTVDEVRGEPILKRHEVRRLSGLFVI